MNNKKIDQSDQINDLYEELEEMTSIILDILKLHDQLNLKLGYIRLGMKNLRRDSFNHESENSG